MFLGIRKKYWWYLLATIALVGLMVFLNRSPVFALKQTRAAGPFAGRVGDIAQDIRQSGVNVFRCNKEELARMMLTRDDIEKVDLSLSLPDGIRAEVNRFDPVVLLLADRLYGLDLFCRLIPHDTDWENIDLPVMTGLSTGKLFHAPKDYRVSEVLKGLMQVKEEMPDLFRQIAEIDFSNRVYVSIYLTTGTDRYLACSRDFASQMIKLDAVSRTVARSGDGCFNLQYDGVVIKQK